jgi:hypothetical protein
MYNMFTQQGNEKVALLVAQARQLSGVDGPVNPMEQAWNWLVNELDALSEQKGFEEAADTAVREAAYDSFI